MRYIKIGKSYPLGESPDSHLTRRLPSSIPWFVQPALQYLLFTLRRFDDAAVAEAWLISQRCPDGVFCPVCGGDSIAHPIDRRPFSYRCRSCCLQFGVKTRSLLRCSKLSLTAWVQAIYLSSAVINPVGLDTRAILTITPRAARNLAWRIREAWDVAHETAPHDAQVEGPLNLIGRARTSQRGQVVLPPRIPTAPETSRDLSSSGSLGTTRGSTTARDSKRSETRWKIRPRRRKEESIRSQPSLLRERGEWQHSRSRRNGPPARAVSYRYISSSAE